VWRTVPSPPVEQDYQSVLGEAERVLDDVDQALARIDAGSYTTCESCGQTISEERLAAHPVARTCERHPQLTDPTV
jgi:RNA polymerase-binding transcription factor DksA